ncbi:MAG: hypothetical protein GXP54_11560 [Deltaproteobacteria bacterium]|nr:hypothetical protein [Deltaproteobacteria bacterium]
MTGRHLLPIAAILSLGQALTAGTLKAEQPLEDTAAKKPATAKPVPAVAGDEIEVPPPPFSEGIYPCSDCHEDMEVNRKRRKLTEEHENIVLKHDEKNRWCLDCHDAEDRDYLHLASGKKISFDESYLLCGQCHGTKLRDWKAGVHGRRTGYWNGKKKYLLCANCHNPHSPRFKPIPPKPAPRRPVPGLQWKRKREYR